MDDDQVKRRLELLDQRLDNSDSVVTALVERVMKQPVTINLTCPKCGSEIQVMLTSNVKGVGKS